MVHPFTIDISKPGTGVNIPLTHDERRDACRVVSREEFDRLRESHDWQTQRIVLVNIGTRPDGTPDMREYHVLKGPYRKK